MPRARHRDKDHVVYFADMGDVIECQTPDGKGFAMSPAAFEFRYEVLDDEEAERSVAETPAPEPPMPEPDDDEDYVPDEELDPVAIPLPNHYYEHPRTGEKFHGRLAAQKAGLVIPED